MDAHQSYEQEHTALLILVLHIVELAQDIKMREERKRGK